MLSGSYLFDEFAPEQVRLGFGFGFGLGLGLGLGHLAARATVGGGVRHGPDRAINLDHLLG